MFLTVYKKLLVQIKYVYDQTEVDTFFLDHLSHKQTFQTGISNCRFIKINVYGTNFHDL